MLNNKFGITNEIELSKMEEDYKIKSIRVI